MRILLDNCVSRRCLQLLSKFDAVHVGQLRYERLSNGKLIAAAEGDFDLLVTIDKSVRHQTSLKGRSISVVTLEVRNGDIDEQIRFVELLIPRLDQIPAGVFFDVTDERSSDEI